ncbi:hypothetical protein HRR90_002636 [Exophiala dermatitidis]|uniref:Kinetochore protein Sos7 coiled-coil domain-containing protein n=2 Tax=Exophiala dermatitidis TaxID=5970 RepID=H6BQF5_EXODN|nr:uncharacterized protein HMPREF1120_02716 [Exophiala dermatitidis NIH/UT8656]KAJ4511632.1 hypothetical protein HRR73_006207 [Exophiala dermatitidis]EHY54548.1 hypothetical protein HMPREF1120_02716 [Exophiala dermatitidis NIH/UT8656]KAJ4517708.1 hypothetical protein HRR75_002926 [Exophiala dermatitidis]KAJ4521365.1 hypothetical protein HRR74_003188 [Exophiala dermatitidis]KAJ4542036.1 hypothetical protein HRR77_005924 [Exophiala dermatitidis]
MSMAANSVDYDATLANLRAQQTSQPLSILTLAEPITASSLSKTQSQSQSPRSCTNASQGPQPRASDVGNTSNSTVSHGTSASDFASNGKNVSAEGAQQQLTPASLAADLAHYKDLFSKLRFSYLEQVTKEKYLRSIVGDPPLVVSHSDNLALETKLAAMKAELQTKKRGVDALVAQMEEQARVLAQRYDEVAHGMELLATIPPQIDDLRREIEVLQAEVAKRRKGSTFDDDERDGESDDISARMNMPLEATQQALDDLKARNLELDHQISLLQHQMPAKDREVEKVDRELAELEKRRNESTRLAVELRKRREQGGGRDEMEELGRWYRGSEAVLRGVLCLEDVVGVEG